MTTSNNNLSALQTLILPPANPKSGNSNVFQAMAEAFAQRLDSIAQEVADKAAQLGQEGNDTPGAVTLLSAAAAELSFNANSAQNSISEYSQSLKTTAKGS
jgi:hypothetical protein